MNDEALLGECPDYLSIGAMLKATPSTEGGRRYLYMEASNEGLDQQAEVVAKAALADSASYYLRYGNVDIDHLTQIGPKLGIPDYALYEVGRPVDVAQRGSATFVKAEIFAGEGPAAEKANMLWSGLTEIKPEQRWYPSVGGVIPKEGKSVVADAQAPGGRKVVISKVRWTNIGLSKTPVNQHVAACAVIPVGAFAKSWGVGGLDIRKALEAGYGTDSATLEGGAAMRKQSLDKKPINYWDWRDSVSNAMRKGECGDNTARSLIDHSVKTYGYSEDEAAEHVERFMNDLRAGLKQRKSA